MVEAALYALLAAILATRRPLRDLWRQLGLAHRVFLAAFFALLVAGQLADDGLRTFPFVPWTMYTERATGDPSFREYRVRLASGRVRELSAFARPPTLSIQMQHALEQRAGGIVRAAGEAERAAAVREYDRTLRALAAGSASADPGDPPVAVEVTRVTIPLRAYRGPGSLRREPVHSVDLR
jgi:hypothetical protein